jgi:hypothetical protein
MQAVKDAAIVLALILLAATIRITPLDGAAGLIPEAQAATAERSVEATSSSPVVRSSSSARESRMQPLQQNRPSTLPPMGVRPQRVLIEVKRDRPIEAAIDNCPTDPDRSVKAPTAGSTC